MLSQYANFGSHSSMILTFYSDNLFSRANWVRVVPPQFVFLACYPNLPGRRCPATVCFHGVLVGLPGYELPHPCLPSLHFDLACWVRVISPQLTFKASCPDLQGMICLAYVGLHSSYISSSLRCAAKAFWVWAVSLLLRHVVSHTYRIRVVLPLFAIIRCCWARVFSPFLAFMMWCPGMLGTVHSGYVQSLIYFI